MWISIKSWTEIVQLLQFFIFKNQESKTRNCMKLYFYVEWGKDCGSFKTSLYPSWAETANSLFRIPWLNILITGFMARASKLVKIVSWWENVQGKISLDVSSTIVRGFSSEVLHFSYVSNLHLKFSISLLILRLNEYV